MAFEFRTAVKIKYNKIYFKLLFSKNNNINYIYIIMVVCIRKDSELLELCELYLNKKINVHDNLIILKIKYTLDILIEKTKGKYLFKNKISLTEFYRLIPTHDECKTLFEKYPVFIEPYCEFITCFSFNIDSYINCENNTSNQLNNQTNPENILTESANTSIKSKSNSTKPANTSNQLNNQTHPENILTESANTSIKSKSNSTKPANTSIKSNNQTNPENILTKSANTSIKSKNILTKPANNLINSANNQNKSINISLKFIKKYISKLYVIVKHIINSIDDDYFTKNIFLRKNHTNIISKSTDSSSKSTDSSSKSISMSLISAYKYIFNKNNSQNKKLNDLQKFYEKLINKLPEEFNELKEYLTSLCSIMQNIKEPTLAGFSNTYDIILVSISMFDSYQNIRLYYNKILKFKKEFIINTLKKHCNIIKEKYINNLFRFQFSYFTRIKYRFNSLDFYIKINNYLVKNIFKENIILKNNINKKRSIKKYIKEKLFDKEYMLFITNMQDYYKFIQPIKEQLKYDKFKVNNTKKNPLDVNESNRKPVNSKLGNS